MKISAIVCTSNRITAITTCLQAILVALQQVDGSREILVIDNGSSDGTSDAVAAFAVTCPLPLRLVSEPRKGLSHARNAALREAKGNLLAFTDDDCHPQPDYYINLLKLTEADSEPTLRGGKVLLGDPSDQPFSILTRDEPERWQQTRFPATGRNLGCAFIGANMVIPREIANKVGLFDPRYGAGGKFLGGEEIDYIYRAYLAGCLIAYSPELVINHFHGRKSLDEVRKLAMNYDLGDGALYAKYLFRAPALLRPLVWDIKKALREPFGGPLCRPELGITHRARLWRVAKGMTRYWVDNTKKLISC